MFRLPTIFFQLFRLLYRLNFYLVSRTCG